MKHRLNTTILFIIISLIIILTGCSKDFGIDGHIIKNNTQFKNSINGSLLQSLAKNTKVRILARAGTNENPLEIKYFKIRLMNKKIGWINSDSVKIDIDKSKLASTIPHINYLNKSLVNAIKSHNFKKVKEFINRGADINTHLNRDITPLMLAIQSKFNKAIKLLILNGANVNAKNKIGRTPIMYIAQSQSSEIAQFLFINGADITIKDKFGNNAFLIAADAANYSLLKFLIEQGADINSVNNKNQNALHLVASHFLYGDKIKSIKYLVTCGLDIHHRDSYKNTVLMRAAYTWSYDVVKYLLKKGAKVSAKNKSGSTPLIEAASGYWFGQRDKEQLILVVKLLLKNGADVNAKSQKYTALKWAIKHKHKKLIILLKSNGAR